MEQSDKNHPQMMKKKGRDFLDLIFLSEVPELQKWDKLKVINHIWRVLKFYEKYANLVLISSCLRWLCFSGIMNQKALSGEHTVALMPLSAHKNQAFPFCACRK